MWLVNRSLLREYGAYDCDQRFYLDCSELGRSYCCTVGMGTSPIFSSILVVAELTRNLREFSLSLRLFR